MFVDFQTNPYDYCKDFLSDDAGKQDLWHHAGYRIHYSTPFDPEGNIFGKPDTAWPKTTCLAPREQEVLFWAAQGKSAWETAIVLNLTESTIKFYLRNACKRLSAQNKTHAVALCLVYGLFKR